MKQVGVVVLVIVFIAIVVLAGLMLWGRFMLHNREIPVRSQLIEETPSFIYSRIFDREYFWEVR